MTDGVKLEAFDHVGLVVKSRAATIKSWSDKMGVGPWRLTEAGQGPVALAHARVAGTLFELIEPVEGKVSLARFLEYTGRGTPSYRHPRHRRGRNSSEDGRPRRQDPDIHPRRVDGLRGNRRARQRHQRTLEC